MSFESPFMLLGLSSLFIIIWLHFRHKKTDKIKFPAVVLLKQIAKKRTPVLKFKNLLLLFIRLLLVLVFVFAMSRPQIFVWRPGGVRDGAALAQVIILDDTLSMGQQLPDGSTAFENAKKLAMSELERLRPGDGTALILAGNPMRVLVADITSDFETIRRSINLAKPGYRSGDIEEAVQAAAQMLMNSQLSQREILLITDLSENELGEDKIKNLDVEFRVLGAVTGDTPCNIAVNNINVTLSGDGISKESIISAKIANFSLKPKQNLKIELEIDGQVVASGSLDIAASGFAIKNFNHRFDTEEYHRGLIRIQDDILKKDNVRHFSVIVRKSISVLVIDGDYRPGSYLDEAFYLQRALQTPMIGEVPIKSIVMDVASAESGTFGEHDVVFLAGVDMPSPSLCARLVEYVHGGGGLFIAPGDKGGTFDLLSNVLPARIRSVRSSSRPSKAFKFGAINRQHSMFAPFGNGPSGLENTRIFSHVLVEPDPAIERTVISQLKDGVPFLLERQSGKGNVILLTTTLDRDWTDLPIRPGYLPMIQRATRHLAGRLSDREPKRILIGDVIELEVSDAMQRLQVLLPDKTEIVFPAKELAGKSKIKFKDTFIPGSYRVWVETPEFGGARELPAAEFVVEADPDESNLARKDIAAKGIKSDDAGLFTTAKGKLPLWPYLLFAGIFLLLLESLIAGLGLNRSHAKKNRN